MVSHPMKSELAENEAATRQDAGELGIPYFNCLLISSVPDLIPSLTTLCVGGVRIWISQLEEWEEPSTPPTNVATCN